jgi:signal transduction histidine kinase
MMQPKWLKPSLIAGVLMLILTGLFFKTQALNLDRHYQIISQFRQVKHIDALINADVLKSRFSLSANYDALVEDWQQIHEHLGRLDQNIENAVHGARKDISIQWRELNQLVAEKETAVEYFKSQNAVLQNSLRYFPQATHNLLTVLSKDPKQQALVALLHQFLQDSLNYNLNAREELQPKILEDIKQITAIQGQQDAAIATDLDHLIKHGNTLLRLKGEQGEALDQLLAMPSANEIDRLALSYESYHKQLLQESNFYRLLLYFVLVTSLVYIIVLYRGQQRSQMLKQANVWLEQQVSDRTLRLEETVQNLRQSQASLVQAEKMSGLGQLVAGIAHEVNNPINFIAANIKPAQQYALELLQLVALYQENESQPNPQIEEYVEEIDLEFIKSDLPQLLASMKSGTTRITDLVLSLRNFSRLDESDMKIVRLCEGIDSTLLILKHRIQATSDRPEIKIVKDYADLPPIQCYPGQLNQVFMNLMANAIDALEEAFLAGKVTSPLLRIQTMQSDTRWIEVRIGDNGCGIPEGVRSRIFDPFFTTKPVGQGTGLGLSISYQIITEKHGGSLEVRSEVGQGTEFLIRLPIQR